jgi:feruloyl-CoA synthase
MTQDSTAAITDVPFKDVTFLERAIEVDRRQDGTIILKHRDPLDPFERCIPLYLARHAQARPDQTWLAQRRGPQRAWLEVSYAQAKRMVDSLTQAILDMKLVPERPIAILSGNSIEHALLTQAGMQAGIPIVPISPAYSLMSSDHAKLRYIFDLLKPGLVMVQDGVAFAKGLQALDLSDVQVIHVDRPAEGIASRAWSEVVATPVTDAVDAALAAVGPKTVGKILLTSGSTGMPKAVINTQEMMCANVVMARMARPHGADEPTMTLLDWLPWNHTMGGNAGFHLLLAEGGTLYIDDGRPVQGMFDETLNNLREVSPTIYTNVPAGYHMLAQALENDEALARSFFRHLKLLAYGGAALPNELYVRMQKLAIKHTGYRIAFVTGWGSTETAPTATYTYWCTERAGLIGLPYPGVELKMIPAGSRYELRIRSIIVMPGYYRQPELTAAAFDEEGFYKIGDAGNFIDADDPSQGLVFSGRIAEDFKLMSGTFVHVGSLRVAAISAASPVIQDALIAGQDKPFIGLLAWLNLQGARSIAGKAEASLDELIRDPQIRGYLRERLAMHNAQAKGSSMRIARAMLMIEPPSIDRNELTDKGYINQRAALENRQALVERLYAETPDEDVIVIES